MSTTDELRRELHRAAAARTAADDLSAYLEMLSPSQVEVKLPFPYPDDDRVVTIPRGALDRLLEVLEAMGDGQEPSVLPMMKELSTGEVGKLLGVSRQYVVRLIDEGRLGCTRVGSHRRVRIDEALRYLREDNRQRAQRLRDAIEALD